MLRPCHLGALSPLGMLPCLLVSFFVLFLYRGLPPKESSWTLQSLYFAVYQKVFYGPGGIAYRKKEVVHRFGGSAGVAEGAIRLVETVEVGI